MRQHLVSSQEVLQGSFLLCFGLNEFHWSSENSPQLLSQNFLEIGDRCRNPFQVFLNCTTVSEV